MKISATTILSVITLISWHETIYALEPQDMYTVQFLHKCSRFEKIPPKQKNSYTQVEANNIWVFSMQAGICSGYWRAVAETQDSLTEDVCPPKNQHPNEQILSPIFDEFKEYAKNKGGEPAQLTIMSFRRHKWPCSK